ncbi:MAG: hypothetical protein WAP47_01000 [Candidatus Rokuibacteriota bacterium]
MGKHRMKQPPPRRPVWRRVVLGAIIVGAVAAGAAWWLSEAVDVSGGTPRLVLDREVVDLGSLPFEAPVRVVFTLTNRGNGSLKIADVPRVKVLKGC